jgi:hypothetical protein
MARSYQIYGGIVMENVILLWYYFDMIKQRRKHIMYEHVYVRTALSVAFVLGAMSAAAGNAAWSGMSDAE